MADSKKDPQPEVPEAQQFDTASLMKAWEQFYQPMNSSQFIDMNKAIMDQQIAYAPQLIGIQKDAQTALFNNLNYLQRIQAPQNAQMGWDIAKGWAPEFFDTYSALGSRINQGLADGYDLGEGLSNEMEQSIRGAQMARGNWLGPAPTAQEAFGKGQAALDLYNTRLGQAQTYLQGKNTLDMSSQAWNSFTGQPYYPSQSYVDSSLGANIFSSIGNQQGNYNSALGSSMGNYNNSLLQANDQNNNWMFQGYDRTADSWMYREAVRNGLYSTPSMGGGGGMMGGGGMGMMGSIGGAVGTGMMGLAASGIIGGGATAAGVGIAGAAAGAAAAICWLARKLIPGQWKQFRKWLFTKAPTEVRLDYIYNARRLSNQIA